MVLFTRMYSSENNNLEKKDSVDPDHSMKGRVLKIIREKKIRMRRPFVFLAQRLGLESALILVLLIGALLVSLIFYFLKKTQALKHLSLGLPGVKAFLLALPYDYIALFIITLILAIYFANKIELFCGRCKRTEKFAVCFFLIAIALGIFFVIMGAGDFLMR